MTLPVNRTDRRNLLRKGALAGAALTLATATAACSAITGSGQTALQSATQFILDIQGGIGQARIIMAAFGGKLPMNTALAINQALDAASAAFASISSTVGSINTATSLQTAAGALQTAVSAIIAALGVIPGAGTYLAIAQAIAALIPGVISYVSSILSPATTATVTAVAHAREMMPRVAPARSLLGIPALVS